DAFTQARVIFIEPAEALGIVGEDFLALKRHQVIKVGCIGKIFRGLSEGADHRESRQQVSDAIFADEIGQTAGELEIGLAAVADDGAFEGAGGEGEEAENRFGHGVESKEVFWFGKSGKRIKHEGPKNTKDTKSNSLRANRFGREALRLSNLVY